MTKRDLLAVAIRVLGLWMFVSVIIGLPLVVEMSRGSSIEPAGSRAATMWAFGAYSIFMSVAGLVLMACGNGISKLMVSEDKVLSWPEWLCNKAGLFDFASRIYGVILLAKSVPLVVAAIIERYQASANNMQVNNYADQSILTSSITLAIGVCLVVGISRIREYAGNLFTAGKKTLEGPDA